MWFYSPSHEEVKSVSQSLALVSETITTMIEFSSVQFSCSVMTDSLQPHGLQHARPPCPSSTLAVFSNSHPSTWWCHPTISSSVVLFSPTFNISQHQGLFQWVSSSHQVGKVWSFSFSIILSKEHPGLNALFSRIHHNKICGEIDRIPRTLLLILQLSYLP